MLTSINCSFNGQKADLIVGLVSKSAARYKLIDYTYPFLDDPLVLFIPTPILEERSSFLFAVWQPFQNEVYTYFTIAVYNDEL